MAAAAPEGKVDVEVLLLAEIGRPAADQAA
jgi:hypothetical protein